MRKLCSYFDKIVIRMSYLFSCVLYGMIENITHFLYRAQMYFLVIDTMIKAKILFTYYILNLEFGQ